jgi:8-oxo-dGTP pyrophosphatase MutT (NUDIX family)
MKIFAVVALIQNKNGLILATSRRNELNAWGLPGGKVDSGEEPFDALVREETGLEIKKGHIVYDRQDADLGNVLYYQIEYVKGVASQQEDEIKVDWVTPKQLTEGPFGEWNRGLFDRLKIYSGDKHSYRVYWSIEDHDFVGTCDEYPSLTALGSTPDKAWEGIRTLVNELGGFDG